MNSQEYLEYSCFSILFSLLKKNDEFCKSVQNFQIMIFLKCFRTIYLNIQNILYVQLPSEQKYYRATAINLFKGINAVSWTDHIMFHHSMAMYI